MIGRKRKQRELEEMESAIEKIAGFNKFMNYMDSLFDREEMMEIQSFMLRSKKELKRSIKVVDKNRDHCQRVHYEFSENIINNLNTLIIAATISNCVSVTDSRNPKDYPTLKFSIISDDKEIFVMKDTEHGITPEDCDTIINGIKYIITKKER